MAYRNFKESDIKNKLNLIEKQEQLFKSIIKLAPSDLLTELLDEAKKLRPDSEKAISEMIVYPVLLDLKRHNKDFIISHYTQSFALNTPLLTIVEAKGSEKMVKKGVPQCVAQMKGAQIYNQNQNSPLTTIYGCVTSGDEWLFLKLENDTITIDIQKYYLSNISEILGVFQFIIEYYKKILL